MALGDNDASWDMCTGSAPESSRNGHDSTSHHVPAAAAAAAAAPPAAACGLHEHDTEVSAQRNHKVWRQSGGQVDCRPVYVREGASLML